jgi:AcrR family transcriptional regulator
VTIKDIAKHAGCSEGALYRHYTSKDEMAWSLYKREVEKLGSLLSDILNGEGTFSQRLGKSVELFYTFFDKDPEKFKFILLSEYNFPIESKVDPNLNPYNLVFKFVEQGIKKGEFKVCNPKLYSAIIQGIVMQPASLKASGRLSGRMKEKVNEVVDACKRVLRAK